MRCMAVFMTANKRLTSTPSLARSISEAESLSSWRNNGSKALHDLSIPPANYGVFTSRYVGTSGAPITFLVRTSEKVRLEAGRERLLEAHGRARALDWRPTRRGLPVKETLNPRHIFQPP